MVADGFAGVTKGVTIFIVCSCSFRRATYPDIRASSRSRNGSVKVMAHVGILVFTECLREHDGHLLFWTVVEPGTRSPSALRGRGGPGGPAKFILAL